jgi:ribonuclease PH
MERKDGRQPDQLRPVQFDLDFTEQAAGSVLVSFGKTRVLCAASVVEGVPGWMKGQGKGWLTGEYGLLPSSTSTRTRRDGGQPSGRTQEIQRLIGRSLRACIDLTALGERTVYIDCDVLQADGGTRTASITGGFVALALASARLIRRGALSQSPLRRGIAAISCGVIDGTPCLDLPYEEDSRAEVDMNVVMTHTGDFVEVQGTGEGGVLSRPQLDALVSLGTSGCATLAQLQRAALAAYPEALAGLS